MYGASVEWVPDSARRGRYRAEYLHIRDDNVFGLHKDDLVGFSFDDMLGPVAAYARYTLLEGESRDLVGPDSVLPDDPRSRTSSLAPAR